MSVQFYIGIHTQSSKAMKRNLKITYVLYSKKIQLSVFIQYMIILEIDKECTE